MLYRTMKIVWRAAPLTAPNVARIAAKYGNAVGSSIAMIPAPTRNEDRPAPFGARVSRERRRARNTHSNPAATSSTIPIASSRTCRVCADGWAIRATRVRPSAKRITRPPAVETTKTPAVKNERRRIGCSPSAITTAGASVDGLSESSAPTDSTRIASAPTARASHIAAVRWRGMTRVLILTASVGEGHDRPAQTLAAQLRLEEPGVDVVIADCLAAVGRAVVAVSEDAARIVFYRFQWLWDVGYWVFARNRLTREISQRLIARAGGAGLMELIDRVDPKVVVSVYPNVTEVLGRLKRSGRLRLPVVAAITDLAAMHYWASRGIDVHLVTHPESIAAVRSIVGPEATVVCVHGFTLPEFRERREQDDARERLKLPRDGKVVLVSGGGWGVGDIEGAVEEALALSTVSAVVCLCGWHQHLRLTLETRFAGEARVRVEGFTEEMAEWMAAADAL